MAPPIKANALAFDWVSQGETAIQVRVRTASGWSEWQELHGLEDEGPDPGSSEGNGDGRVGSQLMWVGEEIKSVSMRPGEGTISKVRLHAIQSEVVEDRGGPALAQATPSQPPIIHRSQWGADETLRNSADDCEGYPHYASNVRNAYVHHTATSNSYTKAEAAAIVRGIYRFNVKSRGFCDIGYNFLIDRFGRVFEGRWGGITSAVIGAHTGGFNTGATGIAIIGNFVNSSLPHITYIDLKKFLAWKLAYHGVDAGDTVTVIGNGGTKYPKGTKVTLWRITGHKDVAATACPASVYKLLPNLRRDVQKEVLRTRPYPLPGWKPNLTLPKLMTVDAYGGIHPAGGQSHLAHTAYWPERNIARAAIATTSTGGYLVDLHGGIHRFGDASATSGGSYWTGQDMVRGAAPGLAPNSGYVLNKFGGVHTFGPTPPVTTTASWSWDIARDIAMTSNKTGGFVLDGFGGLHPIGTSQKVAGTGYWKDWDIAKAIALRPDGKSGWVLDGYGGLHPFGGAPKVKSNYYTAGRNTARDVVLNAAGDGGWILNSDGKLYAWGNTVNVPHSMTWRNVGIGKTALLAP
jgi:hypothetical protein